MYMESMTLREVCDALDVSRRAVQGYEKAGLVSPSGKNERGHLLYDESARERIKRIRLFQRIGFKIKEIKELMDAPSDVVEMQVKEQITRLEGQKAGLDEIIKEANELIGQMR